MTISSKKSSRSGVHEDRISQLPEEIIHQILHLLYNPREAARTSILSRTWRHLWQTYPFVEFWYLSERRRNPDSVPPTDEFQSFANATFMRLRRRRRNLPDSVVPPLDAFHIAFETSSDSDNEKLLVDELLSTASLLPTNDDGCCSRSPLRIYFHCHPTTYPRFFYRLPDGVFLSCSRTKFLSLAGCDLTHYHSNRYNNIRLDSLEELRLAYCRITQQILQVCLLPNTPKLKTLQLQFSYDDVLDSLDVSHPNLKTLRVLQDSADGRKMQLQLTSAPLLHTLGLAYWHALKVTVSSAASVPNLKSLELDDKAPYQGFRLHDVTSIFPHLESIDFYKGGRAVVSRLQLPWLKIDDNSAASKLRSLKLTYTWLKEPLEIDAPNLASLCIDTENGVHNINVINVAPNCQCVVHWRIKPYTFSRDWFPGLRSCLATLTQFPRRSVLNLYFHPWNRVKEVFGPNQLLEWASSPPLEVQRLQLGRGYSSKLFDEDASYTIRILEGLLRTCHPKTISIGQNASPTDRDRFRLQIRHQKRMILGLSPYSHHRRSNGGGRRELVIFRRGSDVLEQYLEEPAAGAVTKATELYKRDPDVRRELQVEQRDKGVTGLSTSVGKSRK
ncbi:unnamed protein product [Linum tenue]|uniref:F-box domain-containing protein n=1 Tax=Linum tenue TaxID=586396 RepID=A0AAV0NL83_9ROSI|nr:unnamed protein product [Linum tenue]